jgi:chromosome partitioning protein
LHGAIPFFVPRVAPVGLVVSCEGAAISARNAKKEEGVRIIAVANQKGGCGKTTTAINLSSCLTLGGKKVLLIDVDPQSHATMGLNVELADGKSMYHVMAPSQAGQVKIEDIIVPVKSNFDIAPSDVTLSAVEQELVGVEGRENRLLEAIQAITEPYDFVIIDCPPSIGHLCFNALRASSKAIIPIDMSLFSLRGVAKLAEIISLLEHRCDHAVEARALVTMYDHRTRYSRQVLDKVREKFKDQVFDTVIRYNIRLRETVDHGLPVGDYDKHAIGQKDYESLAGEVISWIGTLARQEDASEGPDDIRRTTEEYIDSVHEAPIPDGSGHDFEEAFPYPAQSSYSAMVEAIATSAGTPILDGEERFEEPE